MPGLWRGHQSRKQRAGRAGPGCPAPGGPAAAEPGSRDRGSQRASSWSLSRGVRAARPREGLGNLGAPIEVNFVCVISPSAPLPPLLRPAPRGSIFSSLASFRSRCLAQHDVMPAAPRFPRERELRSRLSPPPQQLTQARVTSSKLWGDHPQGPLLSPLKIGAAHGGHFIFPTLAPPPAQSRSPGTENSGPYICLILLGVLLRAGGARRCFLLAAHNARASRRSACAQQ